MGLLNVGTSSFTASGWERSFYPTGTKSTDFLRYYATRFNTVEIDSTFYGIPASATVQGWASKTPNNFVFAAKTLETPYPCVFHYHPAVKLLVSEVLDVHAVLASIP
jgi:uncharacterized protein YecE (DUF72 family)